MVCPSPKCKRIALYLELFAYSKNRMGGIVRGILVKKWQLLPESVAQSFPDYIPKAILDDYNEACLIRDLSPKASATLARRCLQGIIRDFWKVKVKSGKLKHEIGAIEDRVDADTWSAIDAVRQVGNIGAHMGKNVNLIVDIEPNEADLLIKLIEILLKDWYIAREQKKSHLEAVAKIAVDKKQVNSQETDTNSE